MAIQSPSWALFRLAIGALIVCTSITLQTTALGTEIWLTSNETVGIAWNGSCAAECPETNPCHILPRSNLTNDIDQDCQIIFMNGIWDTSDVVFENNFSDITTTFYCLGNVTNLELSILTNNSVQLMPHPTQALDERPVFSQGFFSISSGVSNVNITLDNVDLEDHVVSVLSKEANQDLKFEISNANFVSTQKTSLLTWNATSAANTLFIMQGVTMTSESAHPVFNLVGLQESRIISSTITANGILFPYQITNVLFYESNIRVSQIFELELGVSQISSLVSFGSIVGCSHPMPMICPFGSAKFEYIEDSIFSRLEFATDNEATLIGSEFSNVNFNFSSTGLIVHQCDFNLQDEGSGLKIGAFEAGPAGAMLMELNGTTIKTSPVSDGVVFAGNPLTLQSQNLIIDNIMVEGNSKVETSDITVTSSISSTHNEGHPLITGLGNDALLTLYSIEIIGVNISLNEFKQFIYAPTNLTTHISLNENAAIIGTPSTYTSIDWNDNLLPGEVPMQNEHYSVVTLTDATQGPLPSTTSGTNSTYQFNISVEASGLLSFQLDTPIIPISPPSQEVPMTQPSAQPVSTPSEVIPISPPSQEIPMAQPSVQPVSPPPPPPPPPSEVIPISPPSQTVPLTPIANPVPFNAPSDVLNPNVRTPTAKSNKTAIIVGSVLGVVAAIALGVGIALYLKFRKPTYMEERRSLLGRQGY